ncbi:MAG: transglycosylase domain-containing protein [Rectinemataceae bacterium]
MVSSCGNHMETSPMKAIPRKGTAGRRLSGIDARSAHALARRYAKGGAGSASSSTSSGSAAQPMSAPAKRRFRTTPGRVFAAAVKIFLVIHIFYIVATSTLIIAYRFIEPPATVLMPYRAIGYGWKLEAPRPLPLSSIPGYLKTMLVAVEDGKFYTHFGIDFEAFKRAKQINDQVGKPLYGGSTLTMQVARTLFLVPEKSYVRKYFEVIAALELELFLTKDRILELYFGYAEWGRGIFGIEAAARHWYGKGVSALTRDEGARLIALLSSPIRYSPTTLQKSGILRERYAYLTRRFVSGNAAASVSPDLIELPPKPLPSVEPGIEENAESALPSTAVPATGETVPQDAASAGIGATGTESTIPAGDASSLSSGAPSVPAESPSVEPLAPTQP